MSGSLNRVTLIGHVGADPESRSFTNGGKVVNLRIATSENWKDKATGEQREKTEWHSVAIFNEALGGIVERYVRKGSKIFIEGKLQTRKWQDQSGADRYSTEIVLQGHDGLIRLLDSRRNGDQGMVDASIYGTDQRSAQASHNEVRELVDLDDDVPF